MFSEFDTFGIKYMSSNENIYTFSSAYTYFYSCL